MNQQAHKGLEMNFLTGIYLILLLVNSAIVFLRRRYYITSQSLFGLSSSLFKPSVKVYWMSLLLDNISSVLRWREQKVLDFR